MQLSHDFIVPAGLEQTWMLLTDLERVAPCLPGATLSGREGETFHGTVKIKVGPIGANIKGTAAFVEADDDRHTALIAMEGKDTKGAASVRAQLKARLEPVDGTTTRVVLLTELELKGRMAQFGRGAIADVSHRILGQFTENISREIGASTPGFLSLAAEETKGRQERSNFAGPSGTATGNVRPLSQQPLSQPTVSAPTELNALTLVGPLVAERVLPPLLGLVLGYLVARAYPRRR